MLVFEERVPPSFRKAKVIQAGVGNVIRKEKKYENTLMRVAKRRAGQGMSSGGKMIVSKSGLSGVFFKRKE